MEDGSGFGDAGLGVGGEYLRLVGRGGGERLAGTMDPGAAATGGDDGGGGHGGGCGCGCGKYDK